MPRRYHLLPIASLTVRTVDAERTADDPVDERPTSTRTAPGPRPAERRTTELRTRGRRTDPDDSDSRGRAPASTDYQADDARPDARPEARPETRPVPTNIYRARRPAVAILLIVPAVAVGLLLLRALAISAFGDPFLIGGVIASACALASLPLLVAGLYGLITGAAHGAEHYGFRVWARPPLAYLCVGLALALAAGLAIR
jgi:hypothetical protein